MNKLISWKPRASIHNLFIRAKIINDIRIFFINRGLLEVETPVMSHTTVPDIYLFPFQTNLYFLEKVPEKGVPMYLITSPEYHMKRLLAAGSGPIFQICHSFRNQEYGNYHNPEFTLLEWYRPYYNMVDIMDEVNIFLQTIIHCDSAEMLSYQQVFRLHVGIDPLLAELDELNQVLVKFNLSSTISLYNDRDKLLDFLFLMLVRPHLGNNKPVFIYNFPASQSLLAELNSDDHRVAERFEVYFHGIELANGSRELTDADLQRERFMQENNKQVAMNRPPRLIDEQLLAALECGLPSCSGVALGIDRLLMLTLKAKHISEVMAFSVTDA
ncbi:MAG: elongation factor P--(R)-beta-lysine ligase [Candidatus Baumannia cicadellinicola]|nr:elongation factor P--(R)-beta-lysine ligase [Candidatus Baumannia cicadellinicola]MCJ7461931.1 elongation factor P--(R)-beta-lysine ligase [Candidatus Baumannia cicadellinicola]MCJ7463115.1 elongation factor P--(R)-beta-lysine ligase [Candidatus Baumannia cicadellinicola]